MYNFVHFYFVLFIHSYFIINNREGTVWLELEEKWNKRAKEVELQYFRFAETLRELANQYHDEAEQERNNWN